MGSLAYSMTSVGKNPGLYTEIFSPEVAHEKTGMNILLWSDYNIAGQISMLQNLINKYTKHKARFVLINQDYANHPVDIMFNPKNADSLKLLRQLALSADIIHCHRSPQLLQNDIFFDCIKPNNSLVQYWGSDIRLNNEAIHDWHLKTGIPGLSAYDPTMLRPNGCLPYHINVMVDIDKLVPCDPIGKDGKIKIIHPSTNRAIKRTDIFLKLKEKFEKKYSNLEFILVEGKTNEECLEIKKHCQITFDQIGFGAYGLSAIESMGMGHVVFTRIANFCMSYHPNMPIIPVDEDNVELMLERCLNNIPEMIKTGYAGREWVCRNHAPRKILKQYIWLYDYIKNGVKFVKDSNSDILLKYKEEFKYEPDSVMQTLHS